MQTNFSLALVARLSVKSINQLEELPFHGGVLGANQFTRKLTIP